MKVDVDIIKLPNKDISRYEIYIEGYHYTNSMRFPIKNNLLSRMNLIVLLNSVNKKMRKMFLKEFTELLK